MTTITLEVPNQSVGEYKEIFNYFVGNYNIKQLKNIKTDIEISTHLYKDYNNDIEGQNNAFSIDSDNEKEILSELKKSLWN